MSATAQTARTPHPYARVEFPTSLSEFFQRYGEFVRVEDECLIWTRCTVPANRGGHAMARISQQTVRLHRLVWELANGKPLGRTHLIRNPQECRSQACINHEHWKPVPKSRIGQVMSKQGRLSSGFVHSMAIAKAHRKHSKLTIEAVREIRASNETGIALGKKFGVSNSMIGMIRRGQSWKEPTPWQYSPAIREIARKVGV